MAAITRLLISSIYQNQPNQNPPSLSHYQSLHLTKPTFNPHPNSNSSSLISRQQPKKRRLQMVAYASANQPLDLTEENIKKVLTDARVELAQLFDSSVGITGQAQLAELDGPFVKIRLTGKFWHKRSTVLARLENYLRQRIPEILEVDIEDEKQLDDSPANF